MTSFVAKKVERLSSLKHSFEAIDHLEARSQTLRVTLESLDSLSCHIKNIEQRVARAAGADEVLHDNTLLNSPRMETNTMDSQPHMSPQKEKRRSIVSNTVERVRSISIDLSHGQTSAAMFEKVKRKNGNLVKWLHGEEMNEPMKTPDFEGLPPPQSEPHRRKSFLGNIIPVKLSRTTSAVPNLETSHQRSNSLVGNLIYGERERSSSSSAPLLNLDTIEDEVKSIFGRSKRCNSASPTLNPEDWAMDKDETQWSRFKTMARKRLNSSSSNVSTHHFDARAFLPDAISFQDCISESSLARIFLESISLKDSYKWMFICYVEEFEALLPSISISDQIVFASHIIKTFLTMDSPFQIIGTLAQTDGNELDMRLKRLALSTAEDSSLPHDLFRSAYETIMDDLQRTFNKFKETPDYSTMLKQHERLKKLATLDDLVKDPWLCFVFWAYLCKSGQHNHVGFWMETHFCLSRLFKEIQDATDNQLLRNRSVNRYLHFAETMYEKYLASRSPLRIPSDAIKARDTVIGLLGRWKKDELLLSLQECETLCQNMDILKQEALNDMKQKFPDRFQDFIDSETYKAYRDVDETISSEKRMVNLLRKCQVPLHRAPAYVNVKPELAHLAASRADDPVCNVFSFELECVESEYRMRIQNLFVGNNAAGVDLVDDLRPFVVPESDSAAGAPSDHKKPSIVFNVLIGSGQNIFYGAIFRAYVPDKTCPGFFVPKGFCMLSRYPLFESLRKKIFALCPQGNLNSKRLVYTDMLSEIVREMPFLPSPVNGLGPIDFNLQDIFQCLSLRNVIQLMSFVMLERKIILVSSNYTVLMSVAEALRTLLSPLEWSHVSIPVLPKMMQEYLHCPTPFIFGLHKSYYSELNIPPVSPDLVLVDLDRDTIEGGDDVVLPESVSSTLYDELFNVLHHRVASRDALPTPMDEQLEFPAQRLREIFHTTILNILTKLEVRITRFQANDQCIATVDGKDFREWETDFQPFLTQFLQTQSVSERLATYDKVPIVQNF